MKSDDLILVAAMFLGFMLYSKKAAAKQPVTPTSPKPAQQGASLATMGQYWTNLLGPAVGAAVSKGTFSYDTWSGSAQVQQQQAADAAQLAGFTAPDDAPTVDNSTYWGIE